MNRAGKRLLRKSEIDDIVSAIPFIPTALATEKQHNTDQVRNLYKLLLRNEEIYPDKIEALKGHIRNRFYRSLISAGEPIGLHTGEAVGQQMTQINLNTFHFAGSTKGVSAGIDGFREIFNALQHRKREMTHIHFKDKDMTFEEVLDKKRQLVGATVEDFVKLKISRKGRATDPWYEFIGLLDIVVPDISHYWVRLELDRQKMYSYQVTTHEISAAIQRRNNACVLCVPSPTSSEKCIVDVYPMTAELRDTFCGAGKHPGGFSTLDEDGISSIFIQSVFIPVLSEINIRGISKIVNLLPVSSRVWSIVRSEHLERTKYKIEGDADLTNCRLFNPDTREEIEDESIRPILIEVPSNYDKSKLRPESSQRWEIWLDKIVMRTKGITQERLINLLEYAGFTVEILTEYLSVIPPKNWIERYKLWKYEEVDEIKLVKPGDYIDMLISQAEYSHTRLQKLARLSGREEPEVPKILRIGKYVYAECDGCNLKQTLIHPLVDGRYTICNNPHEIFRTLGIEACRNYIAYETYRMLSANAIHISSRFITIIADFMTNSGNLLAINSRGVARQNRGVFADASFEYPIEHFIRSATGGRWEETNSTSGSIFLGKRAKFGTGSFGLHVNQDDVVALNKFDNQINQLFQSSSSEINLDAATEDDFAYVHATLTGTGEDKQNQVSYIPANNQPIQVAQVRVTNRKGPLPSVTAINASAWALSVINAANPESDTYMEILIQNYLTEPDVKEVAYIDVYNLEQLR